MKNLNPKVMTLISAIFSLNYIWCASAFADCDTEVRARLNALEEELTKVYQSCEIIRTTAGSGCKENKAEAEAIKKQMKQLKIDNPDC